MLYIFFFGFIILFWGGYILLGIFVGWGVVTVVVLFLHGIFDRIGTLFRQPGPRITDARGKARVRLDDPIGMMSVISHRYSDPLFLKDLTFLEVQLFGKSSREVIELFRTAEIDPRAEVCGACAGKMLFKIAHDRKRLMAENRWTSEQALLWEKGTPREFQEVLSSYEAYGQSS